MSPLGGNAITQFRLSGCPRMCVNALAASFLNDSTVRNLFRNRSIDVLKNLSISASRSKNRQPKRDASIAPIDVLPTQLTPVIKTLM